MSRANTSKPAVREKAAATNIIGNEEEANQMIDTAELDSSSQAELSSSEVTSVWSFIEQRVLTLPTRIKGGKFKDNKGLDRTIWPEFWVPLPNPTFKRSPNTVDYNLSGGRGSRVYFWDPYTFWSTVPETIPTCPTCKCEGTSHGWAKQSILPVITLHGRDWLVRKRYKCNSNSCKNIWYTDDPTCMKRLPSYILRQYPGFKNDLGKMILGTDICHLIETIVPKGHISTVAEALRSAALKEFMNSHLTFAEHFDHSNSQQIFAPKSQPVPDFGLFTDKDGFNGAIYNVRDLYSGH